MGRKVGDAVPLSRGAGSPFNTMSPGPRHTSAPSGTFIYSAVWPQQTWAENCGLCPLGGVGPNLTQRGKGRSLHPYQVPS